MFSGFVVTASDAPDSRSDHSAEQHGHSTNSKCAIENEDTRTTADDVVVEEDALQRDVPASKQHTRDVTMHWLLKFHRPHRAVPLGGRSLLLSTHADTSHRFLSGSNLEYLCDEALQRNAGGLLYRPPSQQQQRASPRCLSSSEQMTTAMQQDRQTLNPYWSSPVVIHQPPQQQQQQQFQTSSSSRPNSAALSGRGAVVVSITHTERCDANDAPHTPPPPPLVFLREPRRPSSPKRRMSVSQPNRRSIGMRNSPLRECAEDLRMYDRLASVEKTLVHCAVIPEAFAFRCCRLSRDVAAQQRRRASGFRREVHPAVAVVLVLQQFVREALSKEVVANKRRLRLAERRAWSRGLHVLQQRASLSTAATVPRSPIPPPASNNASTRRGTSDTTMQHFLLSLQTPASRRQLPPRHASLETKNRTGHSPQPRPIALTIAEPPPPFAVDDSTCDRRASRGSGRSDDHRDDERKRNSLLLLSSSDPLSASGTDVAASHSTSRRLSVSKATEVSRARRASHHEETVHVSAVLEEAAFSLHKFFVLAAHRWKAHVVACRTRARTESRVQTEQLEIVQAFLRGKQARASYLLHRKVWMRNRAARMIQARIRGLLARLWYTEHHENLMLWLNARVQREVEVTACMRVLSALRRFTAAREVKKRQNLVLLKLLYREESERRQRVQELLDALHLMLGALAARTRLRYAVRRYNDTRVLRERKEDRILQQPAAAQVLLAFWAARKSRALVADRVWIAREIAARERLEQTYLASDAVSRVLSVGAQRHAHEIILRFFSLAAVRWKRSRRRLTAAAAMADTTSLSTTVAFETA